MAKAGILETELYAPVRDYLKKCGYTVHGEVKHCDVTATMGDELVVVEMKTHLSVELLVQCAKRQKVADSVYLAIPRPDALLGTRKWRDICHLLRRLELGCILVTCHSATVSTVEIALHPLPFSKALSAAKNKKPRMHIIREIAGRHGDHNTGGSTRKKLMTAYREKSIFIACCLKKFGSLSPKNLKTYGTDATKTGSILRDNFYQWFYKVKTGVYGISDSGSKELEKYPELVALYEEKLFDTAGQ